MVWAAAAMGGATLGPAGVPSLACSRRRHDGWGNSGPRRRAFLLAPLPRLPSPRCRAFPRPAAGLPIPHDPCPALARAALHHLTPRPALTCHAPVTGCNDVCWTQNVTTCANATANIWTPNDVPNLPLCEWTGTHCIPACTSYTTEIPCSLARYNGSEGTLRSTCSFVDQYYISTITAAIVNLVAIVVLNGVRPARAQRRIPGTDGY